MNLMATIVFVFLVICTGYLVYPVLRNMYIYEMSLIDALGAQILDVTRWSPGYSEIGFHSVQPGMDSREVASLLGPPLSVEGDLVSAWHYTTGPHGGTRSNAAGSTHVRAIVFDGRMKVRAKARYFWFD